MAQEKNVVSRQSIRKPSAVAARKPSPATAEAASTELSRKINRDIVLELIRLRQPVSRVDLARTSGLQNSTVSLIVEQLLAEDWIREGEALKTPRGRRPTQISLNDNLAMLVADIHPGRVVLGAVDLNGQLFAQEEIQILTLVEQSVDQMVEGLNSLRRRFPDRTFMGLGVCIPGRVNIATGAIAFAPNITWSDFNLRDALMARMGMAVEVDNDANACLLSELWFGHLDGVRNAVLLAVSEGVGAALLADSHLITGRMGLAGEFGHICVTPDGPLCECGRKGCWEMVASSRAALRYYQALKPKAPPLQYTRLAELAAEGDAAAVKAVEEQALAIGRGLRLVTAALSPELILFAGDISYSWPLVLPIIAREGKAGLLAGAMPRLVCTGDGSKAHLLGAAALVLQRNSSYYLSRSADQAANAQLAGKRSTEISLIGA